MSEANYEILTPDFRREINASIEKQLAELATCQDNAFTQCQKMALNITRNCINALPDGFPVPMRVGGKT